MGSLRRATPLQWVFGLLLVGILIYWPLTGNTTELRQNSQVVVTVLAVLGVNIATGYGGMISLGHGVFVAVGSFATAYYVDDIGLPWMPSIVLGAATAAVAGGLVGLPALRIKGIHLALVTLGLAIVFQPLTKRFPDFTGGVSGRSVEARFEAPGWFGDTRLADAVWRYIFCIVVVVLALALVRNIVDSRAGRAIRAVRDNDTAAAVHGVDLVRVRVSTFALSAGVAGLAGALQVVLVPFASQSNFPPQESLVLYATAVIGGLGTIWGSVVGVAAREVLGNVGEFLAGVDGLGVLSEFFALLDEETFVFGFGLVVLTFVFPRGLVGSRAAGTPRRIATLWAATKRRYQTSA